MRFWQSVSWMETDQQVEVARFAEEVGFYGLLHGDHFAFPGEIKSHYPMSPDGKPPMGVDWDYPDCWVTIAAQAAVTTRLKFATGIYTMATRHPMVTAKATGTLALISGNRAIMGVAPGWMKEEFDLAGVPFEHRGARLDEGIEVVRKLWSGKLVEHHGRFYDFGPTRMEPMPGYNVPIYIGGANPAAFRRAATLGDGWIGGGDMPEEIPGILAKLNQLRAEAGRADQPFEVIAPVVTPPDLDTFKRLRDAGLDGTVAYPFTFTLGAQSSLDDKKREMERFARAFIQPMAG